uniref:Uncharacterized protein n=1 Tax=Parascaris equorum TaxID=6256 RepID=A0A914S4T4_PAREQ
MVLKLGRSVVRDPAHLAAVVPEHTATHRGVDNAVSKEREVELRAVVVAQGVVPQIALLLVAGRLTPAVGELM